MTPVPASVILRVALSRIIITKNQGASLARDTSHSRPHRVALESDYEVWSGFERSVHQIQNILEQSPPTGGVEIIRDDSRSLPPAHGAGGFHAG